MTIFVFGSTGINPSCMALDALDNCFWVLIEYAGRALSGLKKTTTPFCSVWAGILLYALLCGFLPFEDENVSRLYDKIKLGDYEEPDWLSAGAKRLIKRCLTTNPKERIEINELIEDPWLTR